MIISCCLAIMTWVVIMIGHSALIIIPIAKITYNLLWYINEVWHIDTIIDQSNILELTILLYIMFYVFYMYMRTQGNLKSYDCVNLRSLNIWFWQYKYVWISMNNKCTIIKRMIVCTNIKWAIVFTNLNQLSLYKC